MCRLIRAHVYVYVYVTIAVLAVFCQRFVEEYTWSCTYAAIDVVISFFEREEEGGGYTYATSHVLFLMAPIFFLGGWLAVSLSNVAWMHMYLRYPQIFCNWPVNSWPSIFFFSPFLMEGSWMNLALGKNISSPRDS